MDSGPNRGSVPPGIDAVAKALGTAPAPFKASTRPSALDTRAKPSPPRPHHGSSRTHCTADAAMAASTALPPSDSTAAPVSAASRQPALTTAPQEDSAAMPPPVSGAGSSRPEAHRSDNGDRLNFDEHLRVLEASHEHR